MSSNFLSNFTTRYIDPTEVYGRFRELAAEFPDLTTIIPLPNKTNGYQRRAQALMAGLTNPGLHREPQRRDGRAQAVILTSRAWGHEGGNDLTAEFVNPLVANSPLTVTFIGNDLRVSLATDANGALTSTAAQVAAAINAHPGAAAKLVAQTYRGNAGAGRRPGAAEGQPVRLPDRNRERPGDERPRPARAVRVLRDADREEPAGRERRPGDPRPARRRLPLLPAARPRVGDAADVPRDRGAAAPELRDRQDDAAARRRARHLHPPVLEPGRRALLDAQLQQPAQDDDQLVHGRRPRDRRPERGELLDAAAEPAPGRSRPAVQRLGGPQRLGHRHEPQQHVRDAHRRLHRCVDVDCTSEVFAGPFEASEPEIQNELWIADTFKNIRFSNNIHSFGGYFMWAPGTYLPDRGEGARRCTRTSASRSTSSRPVTGS